jgi:hypothetical protein
MWVGLLQITCIILFIYPLIKGNMTRLYRISIFVCFLKGQGHQCFAEGCFALFRSHSGFVKKKSEKSNRNHEIFITMRFLWNASIRFNSRMAFCPLVLQGHRGFIWKSSLPPPLRNVYMCLSRWCHRLQVRDAVLHWQQQCTTWRH